MIGKITVRILICIVALVVVYMYSTGSLLNVYKSAHDENGVLCTFVDINFEKYEKYVEYSEYNFGLAGCPLFIDGRD